MLSKDYSREFKEAFARRYSEGATITALVKEFGMTKSSVKLWRERIDQGGVDAIDRPSKNKTYSQEFKLEVVRAFLDGEGGYRELTLEYGVRNSSQIRDWVNRYLEGGEGALVTSCTRMGPWRSARTSSAGSPGSSARRASGSSGTACRSPWRRTGASTCRS